MKGSTVSSHPPTSAPPLEAKLHEGPHAEERASRVRRARAVAAATCSLTTSWAVHAVTGDAGVDRLHPARPRTAAMSSTAGADARAAFPARNVDEARAL